MYNSTGVKEVYGSAGANASRIRSVISVPEGKVKVAPTSAFGDKRPWCGLFPSNPFV
ncbi:MAG: Uncharacterised protein [Methanobacteriota archaeon]|nr:MAG: Uncharacterised protein [Euryarchaeota archaeon]